jgi:hypothetical protein
MGQYTGRALHELGLAILLAAVLAPFTVRGYNDTQECNSCSIYILDLSSFAHTRGYPICELDKVVVDPTTGVVYLREKDTGIAEKVGHQYGTHSAPWYLMKVGASCCLRILLSQDFFSHKRSSLTRIKSGNYLAAICNSKVLAAMKGVDWTINEI